MSREAFRAYLAAVAPLAIEGSDDATDGVRTAALLAEMLTAQEMERYPTPADRRDAVRSALSSLRVGAEALREGPARPEPARDPVNLHVLAEPREKPRARTIPAAATAVVFDGTVEMAQAIADWSRGALSWEDRGGGLIYVVDTESQDFGGARSRIVRDQGEYEIRPPA